MQVTSSFDNGGFVETGERQNGTAYVTRVCLSEGSPPFRVPNPATSIDWAYDIHVLWERRVLEYTQQEQAIERMYKADLDEAKRRVRALAYPNG